RFPMSRTPMDLSIIIVNWNSAKFVDKCLSSLYSTIRRIQFEVIVIDNGSHDECGNMMANRFPMAHFIGSQRNLGFGQANNVAFGYATGRNVLLLNPDTEVIGSSIERLVGFLDANPDAGVVGARLLNSDLTIQRTCIQRFPTIFNRVFDLHFLRRA